MKKQTIIIPEVKIKLLGSIFPEKIYFDGERHECPLKVVDDYYKV